MPALSANGGMQQFVQNQTVEGVARIGLDGRPVPVLARDWVIGQDGRSVTIRLRPESRFHDGSPVSSEVVAEVFRTVLPRFTGPIYDDISSIAAADQSSVRVEFRAPAPFMLETLEVPIRKSGAPQIGTGPFMVKPGSADTLVANDDYYLGRPTVGRIEITKYPSVRAAWAEMLRNKIDVLYEVSTDALPSMQDATTVGLFNFQRAYQFTALLNDQSPRLKSRDLRRAINFAVDRAALVRAALDGHGTPSSGPIWRQHWAVRDDPPPWVFDPKAALEALKRVPAGQRSFSCLVPQDYERVALAVKQQLGAFGIDMQVNAADPDTIIKTMESRGFDAILLDIVSGPSMLRPYLMWHRSGPLNSAKLGDAQIDAALDAVRHASSDAEYKAGVLKFQQAMLDDPPAVFLAWSERFRAVSKRFDVPVEPGRDVFATLRLWRPTAQDSRANN